MVLIQLFVAVICAGQNYVFRHIDIVDGLSDNQIRNFTQLPEGRLAIRLVSSLNIYNGATFEHFYYDRQKDYKWTFNRYQIFKDYCDADGRLWMKAPGYLSLFDLNTNLFIYDIEGELEKMGVSKKLKNLFVDENKNFWFLTEDNVFSFYNIKEKKLFAVDIPNSEYTEKYGVPEEIAQYKNLYWIIYSSGLIRCWDSTSQDFIYQDTHFIGKLLAAPDRLSIKATHTGDLWLMSGNAICFYKHIDKTWKETTAVSGASNFFTSMDLDKNGNVWAGTSWLGMRKIDGKTHKVETISGLKLTNGGVSYNDIQCVFIDDSNGLWVGTLWQGICYYHPSMHKFRIVQIIKSETQNTKGSVRCLIESGEGDILIGTTNFGLLQYDLKTEKISKAFNGLITDDIILALYRDRKDRLWIGTYLNGFYCIDGKKITAYNRSTQNLERFPNQNVSRAIFEDANGRFWVSVGNKGVGELDLSTGKITLLKERHPEIAFHNVDFDFYRVDSHTFATYGENGIYYYDTENDKIFIPELDAPDNPKWAKAGIRYYCAYRDSRDLEWFGTERGLRIWDEESRRVYTLTTDNGLHNQTVMSILEDNNRDVWVSTANGISKIDITKNANDYYFSVVNFNISDGVQSGKFHEKSALKTANGNLFFGGIHGFNVFNPEKIIYNKSQQKPTFIGLKLFNQTTNENTEYKGRIVLDKPINNTNEIRLLYNENNITLEFSGLNYVNPAQSFFRYKLENYDRDWTEIVADKQGTATYTGLKPGTYAFKVYAANNDKLWGNEFAELKIVVSPPWWASIYAYIFYFLLLVAGIYLSINYYLRINRIKLIRQRKQEQQKQKEELDQLKFRFFTNISHEFRTPLSLIISPLEAIMKKETDVIRQQKLSKIHKNANELLGLVNQLLDFRKLEMNGEELRMAYGDLVEFVDLAFQSFKEIADNDRINFSLQIKIEQLYMQFDRDKMYKILNNLLSNAFKYTSAGGQVSLSLEKMTENGPDFALIQVADTGKGIPADKLPRIFDRFYQVDNHSANKTGSGIGLHLVKEYVSLHEGTITVESTEDKGSVFSVKIPAKEFAAVPCHFALDAETISGITSPLYSSNNQQDIFLTVRPAITEGSEQKPKILIVEDNPDFRQFLVEQLVESSFQVVQAADGEEGEQQILKEFPDLIISDIMMPKVDGIELCRRIKTNIETSHIPVILLTARASDESKLTGYGAGADEYISKPFNSDILLLRVQKLIEQQQARREQFRKNIDVQPQAVTITPLDEELIRKALTSIEKNIDSTEYSVNELSGDIGVSVRNLYRKIQSITGLSPADFIRSVRLKRAAQLLRDTDLNVSEIADLTGFNTIKYFNKHFKEEFGFSPTQYRQKQ